MAHAFFLGVDVADRETSESPGAVTLALVAKEKDGDDVTFRLDSLRHEDDGGVPSDIADHIQSLVADRPYIGRTSIIVNCRTSTGQAIANALSDNGLDPVEAFMTQGADATGGTPEAASVQLSAYEAVETLTTLYRRGHLTYEEQGTTDVSRLARGIQSFVEHLEDVEEATEAPDTVEQEPTRPKSFDTHVSSTALAAWLASERSFDPSQHLKSELRSDPVEL